MSRVLTSVFVFGFLIPNVNANAAGRCEELFDLTPKKGLLLRIVEAVQGPKKKETPPSVPAVEQQKRLLDSQSSIYVYQRRGQYEQANIMRNELVQSLTKDDFALPLKYIGQGQSGAMWTRMTGGSGVIVKTSKVGWQSPYAEAAAYKINMFFNDFVQVPVTVLRTLQGVKISVQAKVSYAYESRVSAIPRFFIQKLRFFDYLIDNHDRRTENVLFDGGDSIVTIDNGIGFRTTLANTTDFFKRTWPNLSKETSWSLLLVGNASNDQGKTIDRKDATSFIISSLPPRQYYDKLVATPNETFRELLKPYFETAEIDAFIKRKEFFVEIVEEWLGVGHQYPNF